MPTLNEAIERFVAIKRASMRSDETLRWYESVLGTFMREGSDPDAAVESITEDVMLAYIAELRARDVRYPDAVQKPVQEGGLSRASIVSHIRANRAFWAWAARRYKMENPMAAISLPKKVESAPRAIAPTDFVHLFDAVERYSKSPHRDRAILAVLADSGVRRGGIASMSIDKVDLTYHGASVIEKGYKQRWITWTNYTSALVAKWLAVRPTTECDALFTSIRDPHKPLGDSGYNQLLKRLKKKTGVKGRVNPHSFRHGFARQYILAGGDLATLAQLLGHSSTEVTSMFYAVFTRHELQALQASNSPLLRILNSDNLS